MVKKLDKASLYQFLQSAEKAYIVVNFYATYCKPCIREIPELLHLHQDPKGDAEVMFVSLDDGFASDELAHELTHFLASHGVNFPSYHYNIEHAQKFIQEVYPKWNRSIPLNLIFSKEGRLVEQTGITDRSEVELIINQDKAFYSQTDDQ